MTEVVGTDIPQGPEVKWYYGGVSLSETFTHTSGSETLDKTAEYGSCIGTLDGVPVELEETGDETAGTTAVTMAGSEAAGSLVVYYIDKETTGLTHIASCQDVKCDSSASTKTAAVHGQSTKLNTVGALENTSDLEELYYNQEFVSVLMGNKYTACPSTGAGITKWTNKTSGVHKIGALVGKRTTTAGVVIYKWFLIGAQATGVSSSFPTEDMYKRSLKFMVDYWVEASTPEA
jgi:hypothetical protein